MLTGPELRICEVLHQRKRPLRSWLRLSLQDIASPPQSYHIRVITQPTAEELAQLNHRHRRQFLRVSIAGILLLLGVVLLFVMLWLDIRGTSVVMGLNLCLVGAVAVLDQMWRRCPRCNCTFVPNMVRMEIEDSRACPECGLNIDLLCPPPV